VHFPPQDDTKYLTLMLVPDVLEGEEVGARQLECPWEGDGDSLSSCAGDGVRMQVAQLFVCTYPDEADQATPSEPSTVETTPSWLLEYARQEDAMAFM